MHLGEVLYLRAAVGDSKTSQPKSKVFLLDFARPFRLFIVTPSSLSLKSSTDKSVDEKNIFIKTLKVLKFLKN